jgi:predicted ATP-grasp superfamily ATP-dependent carboligase
MRSESSLTRAHPARPSVLLLGNYRPTLAVARTLARDGYRVVLGLDHDGEGTAQHSNCVHEVWDHPPLDEPESFRRQLEAMLADRPDVAVIVPIAEKFVRWCAENHAILASRVTVASPPPGTVLQCLDKLRMLRLAEEAGVPCLAFAAASSLERLYEAAAELGYPVVVRPLSHLLRLGDKKAIIAGDPAALRAQLAAWPVGQDRVLLQRFARGARHDVYFAARGGEALRILEVRIVRTDSPDGTGLSVEGVTVPVSPSLADYVGRLLSALNYTGIGCAQFLVDSADGTTCFLELNPRIAGSHRCTEQAGMDLTRLAVALTGAADRELMPFVYVAGQRYAWTYGDLRGLKAAVARRELSWRQALHPLVLTLATFLRADFHLTWDWRDPLPTLRLFLGKLTAPARLAAFLRRAQASPNLVVAGAGAARAKMSARIPS